MKIFKNISNIGDFERNMKIKCYLLCFTRNYGVKHLVDFEGEKADTYLWRAGFLNVKEKRMTIYYHLEQLFSNIFERRKVNVVEY